MRGGKQNKPAPKLKPLKENQGYIDAIIGEETIAGEEHVIVHWEGFGAGNDTSSMSKTHAKKFPVLKKMLKEFEDNKLPETKMMDAQSPVLQTKDGNSNTDDDDSNSVKALGHTTNMVRREKMTKSKFSLNWYGNDRARLLVPLRVSF